MAIATCVAERDVLNDRTSSDIAVAMKVALAKDGRVAPDRRLLAEQQFADRFHGYREAFYSRGGSLAMGEKLGRVLLAFASDGARTAGSPLARATEILEGYVLVSNESLRNIYGSASLPEHLLPSDSAGAT